MSDDSIGKSILETLDHPCRQTCSGWKQGFNRGVTVGTEAATVGTFAGLKSERDSMLEVLRWVAPQIQPPKEGDLRFEHSRRMYAGLKALLTVNRKVKL